MAPVRKSPHSTSDLLDGTDLNHWLLPVKRSPYGFGKRYSENGSEKEEDHSLRIVETFEQETSRQTTSDYGSDENCDAEEEKTTVQSSFDPVVISSDSETDTPNTSNNKRSCKISTEKPPRRVVTFDILDSDDEEPGQVYMVSVQKEVQTNERKRRNSASNREEPSLSPSKKYAPHSIPLIGAPEDPKQSTNNFLGKFEKSEAERTEYALNSTDSMIDIKEGEFKALESFTCDAKTAGFDEDHSSASKTPSFEDTSQREKQQFEEICNIKYVKQTENDPVCSRETEDSSKVILKVRRDLCNVENESSPSSKHFVDSSTSITREEPSDFDNTSKTFPEMPSFFNKFMESLRLYRNPQISEANPKPEEDISKEIVNSTAPTLKEIFTSNPDAFTDTCKQYIAIEDVEVNKRNTSPALEDPADHIKPFLEYKTEAETSAVASSIKTELELGPIEIQKQNIIQNSSKEEPETKEPRLKDLDADIKPAKPFNRLSFREIIQNEMQHCMLESSDESEEEETTLHENPKATQMIFNVSCTREVIEEKKQDSIVNISNGLKRKSERSAPDIKQEVDDCETSTSTSDDFNDLSLRYIIEKEFHIDCVNENVTGSSSNVLSVLKVRTDLCSNDDSRKDSLQCAETFKASNTVDYTNAYSPTRCRPEIKIEKELDSSSTMVSNALSFKEMIEREKQACENYEEESETCNADSAMVPNIKKEVDYDCEASTLKNEIISTKPSTSLSFQEIIANEMQNCSSEESDQEDTSPSNSSIVHSSIKTELVTSSLSTIEEKVIVEDTVIENCDKIEVDPKPILNTCDKPALSECEFPLVSAYRFEFDSIEDFQPHEDVDRFIDPSLVFNEDIQIPNTSLENEGTIDNVLNLGCGLQLFSNDESINTLPDISLSTNENQLFATLNISPSITKQRRTTARSKRRRKRKY